MTHSARLARFVFLAAAVLPAGASQGAEICITCSAPDAIYRCASDSFEGAATTDARLQLLCITQLAKLGGHASCAADRRKLHACEGELRVVAPEAPAEAAAPSLPATAAQPPAQQPGTAGQPANTTVINKTAPEAPREGPPATVEEMARDTAKTSGENLDNAGKAVTDTAKAAGEQIEKAGDAVGSAAKKTWDCVTSLFKEC